MGDTSVEPDEVIDGDAVEIDPPESVLAQELVIREERANTPAPASVLPSPMEWEASMAVAREIAGTQFVPESYRGRPDAVVAAILTGREMGIGPMQALRQIHMIDGRPTFAADLMLAKMRQGGVMIVDSKIDDQGAWITAKRKDTGEEAEVSFTIEDANSAGLLGKRNWQNYRQDMFWARAVGRLARRLGSDLLGGLVYSREEMEDVEGGGYSDGTGGSYGATSAPVKEFDPEEDLMEGAIPGSADAPKQIASALNTASPTVDWTMVLDDVVAQKWGAGTWRDLEGDELADFWRRLSNTARWIEKEAGPGDFPPVEDGLVVDAIAFAFSGLKVEITHREIEKPETVITAEEGKKLDQIQDEIPFGDDK